MALLTLVLAATPATAKDPEGTAAPGQTGIAGELERLAGTSAQEKVEYAADAVEEMNTVAREVTELLETTKRTGTPEEINCVQARLEIIEALAKQAALGQGNLQGAIGSGASERADFEIRAIAVALNEVREKQAEADACVGQAEAKGGDEELREVTGEAGTGSDTSELPDDAVDYGYDAPEDSPFQ